MTVNLMKNITSKLQKAVNFIDKGYIKQAEIIFLECLDKIDDPASKEYKQALHGLAYIKSELKNFTEANNLYLELLHIARKEEDKQEEAIAYHQLGMVQQAVKNYEEALSYFLKEKEIYLAYFPTFYLGLAANLYECGMVYLQNKQLKDAKYFMEESLLHAKDAGDMLVIGHAYRGLGDVCNESGAKDSALIHYKHALGAFRQVNNKQAIRVVEERMLGM